MKEVSAELVWKVGKAFAGGKVAEGKECSIPNVIRAAGNAHGHVGKHEDS